MSHYEERLQKDLDWIGDRVRAASEDVNEAVRRACHATLNGDHALAYETILRDLPINRAVREIDRLCHAFVARHLPSAGILRYISSVLRLSIGLERVGDYAATICRQVVQLSEAPPATVSRDVEMLGEQARRMFQQAMKAFNDRNPELARGTIGMAKQIDSSFEKVFADLIREGEKESRPIRDLFELLGIFNRLERISDQAKNVCEETIFAATGETKQPKVYHILFVDERNDCWSQLAEILARKAFPESGVYASAGWNPAPALNAEFLAFMDRKGFDQRSVTPSKLPTSHDEIDDYHVIIGLGADPRPHFSQLPFKTVFLEWSVLPTGDTAASSEDLEAASKTISARIHDLMDLLRGEDAA